jgi:GNAT superfamily N-acetyltransferase
MQQTVQIRPASPEDVPGIARVLVDTWRRTFRGLLSDEFLAGMSYERQEQRHGCYLAQDRVNYFVAVDRASGDVIGFINGGPNRHADYQRYPAELYALYVLSERQRCGTGKRLLAALAPRLMESGFPSMMVWVLAKNPNRGFYEHTGAREIASRSIVLQPDVVQEIAYGWDNIAAAAELGIGQA